MFKGLTILTALALVLIVVFSPFFVIWAFNTLFGAALMIEYSLWTWLAVIILGVFLSPNVKVTTKK